MPPGNVKFRGANLFFCIAEENNGRSQRCIHTVDYIHTAHFVVMSEDVVRIVLPYIVHPVCPAMFIKSSVQDSKFMYKLLVITLDSSNLLHCICAVTMTKQTVPTKTMLAHPIRCSFPLEYDL